MDVKQFLGQMFSIKSEKGVQGGYSTKKVRLSTRTLGDILERVCIPVMGSIDTMTYR